MIKLCDTGLTEGLPPALAQEHYVKVLDAVYRERLKKELTAIARLSVYTAIDTAPDDALDILAAQFKVDWYRDDYPTETKRRVIKTAMEVRRYCGTEWAVLKALASIYNNPEIEEWYEYGGTPGHWRVKLNVSDNPDIEPYAIENVEALLGYARRLTSHLEGTVHQTDLPTAELHIGGFAGRGYMTTTLPGLPVTVSFYDADGTTLLDTVTVDGGSSATYDGDEPYKEPTEYYEYEFDGWSLTNGGSANLNVLQNVQYNLSLYPAFEAIPRMFQVVFYSQKGTALQTVEAPYGGSATYTGATPTRSNSGSFVGWSPEPTNISSDTNCYATYTEYADVEIEDDWDTILSRVKNGTYATYYKVGNYKPLDLGTDFGTVDMQIAGIDVDTIGSSTSKAPLSWVAKQMLRGKHRMNPSLVTIYITETALQWTADTEQANGYKSNNQSMQSSSVTETWTVTATTAGTVSVWYKVSSEKNWDKLTVIVNDTTVADAISGEGEWTEHTVVCSAGDSVTVKATYAKDSSQDKFDDTCYIRFASTGTITVLAGGATVKKNKGVSGYQEGTGTIGGWEKSELRAYLESDVLPCIPENVRNAIVLASKEYDLYDTSGTYTSTANVQDKLWIPNRAELRMNGGDTRYAKLYLSYYDLLKGAAYAPTISQDYWLRDVYQSSSRGSFCYRAASSTSMSSYSSAGSSSSYGIVLGFCT